MYTPIIHIAINFCIALNRNILMENIYVKHLDRAILEDAGSIENRMCSVKKGILAHPLKELFSHSLDNQCMLI